MAITVKIKETGATRELSIIDPATGTDWIADMIGNTGAFSDGRFEQDAEDEDLYHVSKEEYEWWNGYITRYERMESEIEIARVYGMREEDIEECKAHFGDGAMEDGPRNVINALEEKREEQAAKKHKIEVAADSTEAEEFCTWLQGKGHEAWVGKSSGQYVDGVEVNTDEAASVILNRLWDEYCNG